MKVAVLSESSADEAAIRVFLEALRGERIEPPSSMPPIRSRGWPAPLITLPSVLRHLHYHSDAEALVVVVDSELSPRETYGPLKIALGLAVPQIEAWYLVARDRHVNEAVWIRGLSSGEFPYASSTLKQKVYGTDRPSLGLETELAREQAARIVRDGHLPRLEELFPGGFGALANDVRSW